MDQGRLDEAQARIAALERQGFLEPEAEKVKAELTLAPPGAGGRQRRGGPRRPGRTSR